MTLEQAKDFIYDWCFCHEVVCSVGKVATLPFDGIQVKIRSGNRRITTFFSLEELILHRQPKDLLASSMDFLKKDLETNVG